VNDIPYLQQLGDQLVESANRRPRRRWRKTVVLVPVIVPLLVGLLFAGAASGRLKWIPWPQPDDLPSGVEPRPQSAEVTLQEGRLDEQQHWRFTAFMSQTGLCLHIEYAGTHRSRNGGCRALPTDEKMGWHIARNSVTERIFVFGALPANRATQIRLRLADGTSISGELIEGSGALEDADFFLISPPWGSRPQLVEALDDQGKTVSRTSNMGLDPHRG
jgi:hypothetical protein